MSVARRIIKGQKYWVIDRTFRSADGVIERYRRVAQVQTRPAAEAEERQIIDYWTAHGTIQPLVRPEQRPKGPKRRVEASQASPEGKKEPTWDDAVKHFREATLPKKKPSTRLGYELLLEGPHVARWAGVKLAAINYAAVEAWDTALVKCGLRPSTRRNHHIILRTVLNSVGPTPDGKPGVYLDELPKLPPLPRVGRTVVEAASEEDVQAIINEVDDEKRYPVRSAQRRSARLAFALAVYAGLRAGETRALRVKDTKRGKIVVRLARTAGVEDAPKSGHQREIPIAEPLAVMLKRAVEGKDEEAYVCTKIDGTPWGDSGLLQALKRACKRLGIVGSRYHGLRHYFATKLFGGGADAITVKDLLGHADLSTTQRYAHASKTRAKAAVAVFAAL
ncbi:MAG: site-specific integrase [Myxococcales bacterium]|nr:site-specific integrase [Myxococcales bacterium]